FFFFSSRRRHTRWPRDWSSDVCSSDLGVVEFHVLRPRRADLIGNDAPQHAVDRLGEQPHHGKGHGSSCKKSDEEQEEEHGESPQSRFFEQICKRERLLLVLSTIRDLRFVSSFMASKLV